jgi:hypothetical protein
VPPPGLERRSICLLSSITLGATECSLNDSEWFLTDNQSGQQPTNDPETVAWERIDPAVWRIPAVALPPLPGDVLTVSTGLEELPAPQFCHFARGVVLEQLPPEASLTLFLTPPRNPESLEAAYEWAADHDLPILPLAACTEEILAAAVRDPHAAAFWRITSPKAGDTVSGILPVIGTADFNPSQVNFFKVEIGVGSNPSEWITLGETHSQPVINDLLERLVASAFPPGEYALRLVVVLKDGNYAGDPHVIPIIIE